MKRLDSGMLLKGLSKFKSTLSTSFGDAEVISTPPPEPPVAPVESPQSLDTPSET